MKRRDCLGLLVCMAACTGSASAVTLDLTPPPWERWDPPAENNQFATFAVWNFDIDPGGDLSIAPDNNATIASNPLACVLCGSSATLPATAVWRNTGAWDFEMAGVIDVSLTNVVDDLPVKYLRAQVTWRGEEADAPTVLVTSATDSSLPGSGLIPQSGGEIIDTDPFGVHTFDVATESWHSLYLAEIRPNPDNENLEIFVAANTTIDGVIIDTVSVIPEPSTALLVLAGLVGIAARHRRPRQIG